MKTFMTSATFTGLCCTRELEENTRFKLRYRSPTISNDGSFNLGYGSFIQIAMIVLLLGSSPSSGRESSDTYFYSLFVFCISRTLLWERERSEYFYFLFVFCISQTLRFLFLFLVCILHFTYSDQAPAPALGGKALTSISISQHNVLQQWLKQCKIAV